MGNDNYVEGGWLVFGLVASVALTAVSFEILRQFEYFGSDLTDVKIAEYNLRQEQYHHTSIEHKALLSQAVDDAKERVLNGMFFRGDNPAAWASVMAPSTLAATFGTILLRNNVRGEGGV